MAVERIDANIQAIISDANRANEKSVEGDEVGAAARKAAVKKIELKKSLLKSGISKNESFQKQNKVNGKIKQILGGAEGPDAAGAMKEWGENKGLQAKLNDAQKNMFKEAMAKNPAKATKSGKALNRLSQDPSFQKAVKSSQHIAGSVQKSIIQDPANEKLASQMLQSKFMQSPKADGKAKGDFMRFGLDQGKGADGKNMGKASVKKAGDMLGTLAKSGVSAKGQRAAMNMVKAQPGNTQAMDNVDSFVQQPSVQKMPNFARGKATELLAKSGGTSEVKEGFEKLTTDPKFKAQTPQNKGRFFSTIGSGKASEFRAITDKSLMALQGNNFPKRSGQVGKFLTQMSGQVKAGGAQNVNPRAAIKNAKSPPLPTAPRMESTEGLNEEDASRARSRNRGKIIQFYTKIQRSYEGSEKKLNSAKYMEDVNSLQNLRESESIDTTVLTPEEKAFVDNRSASVKQKLNQVRNLQRQKSRELRGKRLPPAKRRARMAARRAQGKQAKYFNPNATKMGASTSPKQMQKAVGSNQQQQQALPQSPAQARRMMQQRGGVQTGKQQMSADINQQVAEAVSQMGGQITAENAGQVAQTIAQQVAKQVASQVADQIAQQLGQPGQAKGALPGQKQGQVQQGPQVSTDAWGVPRAMSADLGGARRPAVKAAPGSPAAMAANGPDLGAVEGEKYSGRMLIKDPSQIRTMGEMFESKWKGLNRSEMALLKNMGWSQQDWDTKNDPAAKWPISMATEFVNLNSTQRESVRQLGFSAHDWDKKVQALTMGKNA